MSKWVIVYNNTIHFDSSDPELCSKISSAFGFSGYSFDTRALDTVLFRRTVNDRRRSYFPGQDGTGEFEVQFTLETSDGLGYINHTMYPLSAYHALTQSDDFAFRHVDRGHFHFRVV